MSNSKLKKPNIYLAQNHKNDTAITLKEVCGSRWNLGWICRKHGCLDLKLPNQPNLVRYLIGEIALQGGNFTAEAGYYFSVAGSTHHHGGSGYQGGVNFGNEAAALRYLKKYFNVIACAGNVARNGNALIDQSWIDKL